MVGTPTAASAPASSAPKTSAASAPAPDDTAAAPAAKNGFSLPWNRSNRTGADLQPADTSAPVAEAAPDSSKTKQEPKISRVTAATLGRAANSGKSVPDGPLAPEQFRVVQSPSGTEFYPYDSPTPVPKVLPEGGLVEVVKPGDEWSGIVLPDGTEGIVRTNVLRRARISEMPLEAFEAPSIPAHKPVNYEASANLTLPDLPSPDDTTMPLGQGLLPPLQPEN
jgi:hypothetical protein